MTTLELLPAASSLMPAMLNLPDPDYWEGPCFADAIKHFGPFTHSDYALNDPAARYDRDGWPTFITPGKFVISMGLAGIPIPNGEYTLRWSNVGKARIWGAGFDRAIEGSGSAAVTVTNGTQHDGIRLQIDAIFADTVAPRVQLLFPDHDWSQVFFDPFLDVVSKFDGVRTMNWNRASPTTQWKQNASGTWVPDLKQTKGSWGPDRPLPSSMSWGDQSYGVPWEVIAELANQAGLKELRVNLRHLTTRADARAIAEILLGALDPNVKVGVSDANEVWNGFFEAYHWMLQQVGGTDFDAAQALHAKRTAMLAEQFAAVFGEDRVIGVLEGHWANPAYTARAHATLTDFEKTLVTRFSFAPYYWSHQSNDSIVMNANGDALFAKYPEWKSGFAKFDVSNWGTGPEPSVNDYAAANGITYEAYECGQHLIPQNGDIAAVVDAYKRVNRDPRMRPQTVDYLRTMSERGWRVACYFNGPWGPSSKFGFWPASERYDDEQAPKLLGLLEWQELVNAGAGGVTTRPGPISEATSTVYTTGTLEALSVVTTEASMGNVVSTKAIPPGAITGTYYLDSAGKVAIAFAVQRWDALQAP